jgi:hypothetical protein
LRQALLAHLAASHRSSQVSTKYVVLEEMGVERGLNRIDVAVVGEGLTGFELKSDFDVADRLSTQIHAFNRVFSCINIVVSARAAPDYVSIIPRWWGLWTAIRSADDECSISFVEQRPATGNPLREALSIVSLLRVDEVLAVTARFAEKASETVNASKNRPRVNKRELGRRLADLLSLDELTVAVATTLRERSLRSAALP